MFLDDNAFVTMWISATLLEVARFDTKSTPPDEQLIDSLVTISSYHDKNHPPEDSIVIFWPETYDDTTKTWTCNPVNLYGILQDGFIIADYIMETLRLKSLWKLIEPYIDDT